MRSVGCGLEGMVYSGLGRSFVGTMFVAFRTSLPELVTSLTVVRLGAPDLALGNIFGSNLFNMVLLVPLDLVHPGPLLSAVAPIHALTFLATILVTTIAVMGQFYRVERRIHPIEPDALLVVILVVMAQALIYCFGKEMSLDPAGQHGPSPGDDRFL